MERYYLRDFYIFTNVAETKSLSKTAKIMRMSISSVSKRLSWLESYFNIVLLDKTTRRVELTTEGKRFYQKILKILDDFEFFIKEIKAQELKLCVATYSGAFESFAAECCYKYCVDNNCEISVSSVVGDLTTIGFDQIYIVDEKLIYPHAIHRKLPPIRRGNFIQSQYINRVDISSPAILDNIPLVYLNLYINDNIKYLNDGKQTHRLSGKGLHTSSVKQILNLLLNDKCIAIGIPYAYVKELIRDRSIVEALPNWKIDSKNLYIAWKRRASTDKYICDLVNNLEKKWINFFC